MGKERRYELFEILEDILKETNGLKIKGIKKEKGGISGEYEIEMNGKIIKKEEIKRIGIIISKILYEKEDKIKKNKIKIIEKGSLNYLFNF